jgi:hypothetical protein
MSGFWACESLYSVEIPSSVEVMDCFNHYYFLGNVRFEIRTQIREIEGFWGCSSLMKIEMPSSTTIVRGFDDCRSLLRVIFTGVSEMRKIHGFNSCDSLCEFEVPGSIRIVEGFRECGKLSSFTFGDESRLQVVEGLSFCDSLSEIRIPAFPQHIELLPTCVGTRLIFGSESAIGLDHVESDLAQARRFVSASRLYRISRHTDLEMGSERWQTPRRPKENSMSTMSADFRQGD